MHIKTRRGYATAARKNIIGKLFCHICDGIFLFSEEQHFVMNEATKKVIGNANIKYILANPVMLPIIRSIGAWRIDIYITCVHIPEIRLTAVVKTVGKITLCVILNDIVPIQKPRRGGIIR